MNSTLTSKEKSFLLNDAVYYEILFSCGVSAHDPTDYCSWEHLNFSRMGHARALLYFFECPSADKKWDDDVVSEDFGFPAAGIAIAKDERDRLNKDLFHLSSRRVRHTQSSKAWTNAVLNHIHERAVIFCRPPTHISNSSRIRSSPPTMGRISKSTEERWGS
jgi:hypothetical protein